MGKALLPLVLVLKAGTRNRIRVRKEEIKRMIKRLERMGILQKELMIKVDLKKARVLLQVTVLVLPLLPPKTKRKRENQLRREDTNLENP